MAAVRYLRNAPITEALIDLRVKARRDANEAAFGAALEDLPGFPILERQHQTELTFAGGTGVAPTQTARERFAGWFVRSPDRLSLAQFRVDGFTFNRLKPYTSWGDIFPKAMDLWRLYLEVARPEMVTRLAVRYINHIPLPEGEYDLANFLAAVPPIPEPLPQYVSGFVSHVVIHDPPSGMSGAIRQVFEQSTNGSAMRLLLDNDVYINGQFEPSNPEIAVKLDSLREFKNRIFFNVLTDRLLERFE